MAYRPLPVAQFVPVSFGNMPRIARQQGVIKQNELSFEGILNEVSTRLEGLSGNHFPTVKPVQKSNGKGRR